MRLLLPCCLIAFTVALISCIRYSTGGGYVRFTGTCEGACNHYLSCKSARGQYPGDKTRVACEAECAEIFSTSEPIIVFESLTCEDTIAFVEGSSGRGPGYPESSAQPRQARQTP